MRFPSGFLASSIAVADSFTVTTEFEWLALGARGVAVGACLGRHGTEIGWVGSVGVDGGKCVDDVMLEDGWVSGGVVILHASSFLCFRDGAGAACRAVVNSEGRWPVVFIPSLGMWQILQRRLC